MAAWRARGNDPFPGQHVLYDQTREADGTDRLIQRRTSRATPHFCIGHVLIVMDTEYATQAALVKGISLG